MKRGHFLLLAFVAVLLIAGTVFAQDGTITFLSTHGQMKTE